MGTEGNRREDTGGTWGWAGRAFSGRGMASRSVPLLFRFTPGSTLQGEACGREEPRECVAMVTGSAGVPWGEKVGAAIVAL